MGIWGAGCRWALAPSCVVGRPGQAGRKGAGGMTTEGVGLGLCAQGLKGAQNLPHPSMQTLPKRAHLSLAPPRVSTACQVMVGGTPPPMHSTEHLEFLGT